MDVTRIDRISRIIAGRRSRRRALAEAGIALATGALAGTGLRAGAAEDATPLATADGEKTMYLFLQSFQAGSVAPSPDTEGRYTLTLEQGLGQTVFFSDRPERIFGAVPTPRFLTGLGFPPDNPPNAALLTEVADGGASIAVVELFNPAYDEATRTATYEVAVLAEWENALGIGLTETPADLAALGESFGTAHLFIDDCTNLTICGKTLSQGNHIITKVVGDLPDGAVAACWSPTESDWRCVPCHGQTIGYYDRRCNETYRSECAGLCLAA